MPASEGKNLATPSSYDFGSTSPSSEIEGVSSSYGRGSESSSVEFGSTPSPPANRLLLANITLRGELSSFETPRFLNNFAELVGTSAAKVEVLSIRALKAHNKAAYDAARYASKAAARALNALIPSGEPPELSAKLSAAQHEADAAAAIANGPNKIVLRVSALVPQSTNGAALSKPPTVLNTILGVELLKPIQFSMPEPRTSQTFEDARDD